MSDHGFFDATCVGTKLTAVRSPRSHRSHEGSSGSVRVPFTIVFPTTAHRSRPELRAQSEFPWSTCAADSSDGFVVSHCSARSGSCPFGTAATSLTVSAHFADNPDYQRIHRSVISAISRIIPVSSGSLLGPAGLRNFRFLWNRHCETTSNS